MCSPFGNKYWDEHDKKFPFVVVYGDEREDFQTMKEAEAFLDTLKSAYIEQK